MKLGDWDAYVESRAKRHPQYAYSESDKRTFRERRAGLPPRFPHVVTVVGHHEEHDECVYWLWMNVGPKDGPCCQQYSVKPACTTCLAFRPERRGSDGDVYWECTDDIPEHESEGEWRYVYIHKTGYDYGYCDYGFTDPVAAERFRAWVASQTPHEYDLRES